MSDSPRGGLTVLGSEGLGEGARGHPTLSPMPRTYIPTPELAQVPLYSQVVRAGDAVHLSGQVAWDAQGNIVGVDDPTAQVEQVFENLRIALESAGASFDDVVDVTIFYTDDGAVEPGMAAFADHFTSPGPCLTGIKVAQLAGEDLLLEIKLTAHAPT